MSAIVNGTALCAILSLANWTQRYQWSRTDSNRAPPGAPYAFPSVETKSAPVAHYAGPAGD